MWDLLKGKRTYLISLGLALLAVLFRIDTLVHVDAATGVIAHQWLSDQTYATIAMLLGGGGMAALRAGTSQAAA